MIDDETAFLICQRNGIQLTKGPRLTREVAEAMLRMEAERDSALKWARWAYWWMDKDRPRYNEILEGAPASISQKRESV